MRCITQSFLSPYPPHRSLRAARPKVSARTSVFEKNLNSDDHFDRCFAPYRNEEKPPTKGKEQQ
ncbi:MAG: hypothetical protein DME50_12790 [Verrucomicrobia bacterium]|nr:MAG: hypothetical protein DME78_06000 [Verrucomicrobiota bacterium]PYK64574.1 MAG: hypothetical protein DME50_12790 [Verrucomicrobiota bacterium]